MTSVPQQPRVPVSQKKKNQSNARAQQIVLNLIDGTEDEIIFLEQLRWINQNHYQDVVEERAITKLCGYPLCSQQLGIIPKKKYHISMTLNKVYDITERKMFCSNHCFKASSYLKQQLCTSPLWFRDLEDVPRFTLLKSKMESLGDEINFNIERLEIPKEQQNSEDEMNDANKSQYNESPSNVQDNRTSPEVNLDHGTQQPGVFSQSVGSDAPQLTNEVEKAGDPRGQTEKRVSCELPKPPPAHIDNSDPNRRTTLSDISASISESNSINLDTSKLDSNACAIAKLSATLDYDQNDGDHSKKAKKHSLVEKTASADHPSDKVTNSIVRIHVAMKRVETAEDSKHSPKASELIEICRPRGSSKPSTKVERAEKPIKSPVELVLRVEQCLREWLTVESLYHIVGSEAVTQSMRDKGKIFSSNERIKSDPLMYERYAALCKKLKILEIEEEKYEKDTVGFEVPTKPLPDYEALKEQTKEMEIKVRSFYRGDLKVSFAEPKDEDDDSKPNILPPLHQHAKNAIRRNIVLDKLKIVLSDLCQIVGLNYLDVCENVKKLLFTCRFEAHNITFKPLEWNLIGLILLKLLSVQDHVLQGHLQDKASYVNALLMSYQLENNYLELLCTWLTDVDLILKNDENYESSSCSR